MAATLSSASECVLVHYQPVVDLASGAVMGVEDLAAGEVMRAPAAAVEARAPLRDVVTLMRALHLAGILAITDGEDCETFSWGVVTERHLLISAVSRDEWATAGEATTPDPLCVDIAVAVNGVAAALIGHDCPLAVVLENNRPVGMIGALDLALSLNS